jgi:hypothetical protein
MRIGIAEAGALRRTAYERRIKKKFDPAYPFRPCL